MSQAEDEQRVPGLGVAALFRRRQGLPHAQGDHSGGHGKQAAQDQGQAHTEAMADMYGQAEDRTEPVQKFVVIHRRTQGHGQDEGFS